jgi:competence ComEA-like helix-hairpin-helix protein
MQIHRAVLVALTLAVVLGPWSVPAQSPPRVNDPTMRAEPPAKERPPRVVAAPSDAPVNINTAGVRELMTLSGLNRKGAERIIAFRTARGPFKRPEDIKKVDGLGEDVWERNRARIAVR